MKRKLVLIAFVLCVPALWAADGVIEINQATVEANGGFPYVISKPGSYILSGNLTVSRRKHDGHRGKSRRCDARPQRLRDPML